MNIIIKKKSLNQTSSPSELIKYQTTNDDDVAMAHTNHFTFTLKARNRITHWIETFHSLVSLCVFPVCFVCNGYQQHTTVKRIVSINNATTKNGSRKKWISSIFFQQNSMLLLGHYYCCEQNILLQLGFEPLLLTTHLHTILNQLLCISFIQTMTINSFNFFDKFKQCYYQLIIIIPFVLFCFKTTPASGEISGKKNQDFLPKCKQVIKKCSYLWW